MLFDFKTEFYIDGLWVSPSEPPPGYSNLANMVDGGWALTRPLKFQHPSLGLIWVVPSSFPMRLVDLV